MLGRRQRGDTLVEVLFAFAILSMVVVGSMTIMNQGAQTSQRSLEMTTARQTMDGQADALRFLHDAYIAQFKVASATYDPATPAGQWKLITDNLNDGAVVAPIDAAEKCPATPPTGSFIIDPTNAKRVTDKFEEVQVQPQLTFSGGTLSKARGIWIEGFRSAQTGDSVRDKTRYIDFYIRTCWQAAGQGAPTTLGTIVRLYEPR